MIKQYKTICGLKGILEGEVIKDIEFEYQECQLDLVQTSAIFPDIFSQVISNAGEFHKRRDDRWSKENPNPQMGEYPPSLMGHLMASSRACVTIQIGTQLFYFDEEQQTMFDLVCRERNDS